MPTVTQTNPLGTSIQTGELDDGSVTAVKLATDAVETLKIKDANVTAVKLATDAVETAKIKAVNVTAAKLATDSVETAKVKDDAITLAKIAAGTQGGIQFYGSSGAPSELAAGTNGQFLKTQGAGANPLWATGPSADVELISSQTLGAAATSISFSSIAVSYKMLHVIITGPHAANSDVSWQFNDIGSSKYDFNRFFWTGGSGTFQNTANGSAITAGAGTGSMDYCWADCLILNQTAVDDTTFNVQYICRTSSSPAQKAQFTMGRFDQASAFDVTQIDADAATSGFQTNTVAYLYGYK